MTTHARHLSSLRGAQLAWVTRQSKDPYVANAAVDGWRSRAAYKLMEIDDRHRLLRPAAVVVDLGAAPGSWTQVAVQRTRSRARGTALTAHAHGDIPAGPVRGGAALARLHVLSACADASALNTAASAGAPTTATAEAVRARAANVVAIDLLPIAPVMGAQLLRGDFTSRATRCLVANHLAQASGRGHGGADVVLSDMAHSFSGSGSLDHVRQMALSWTAAIFAFEHLKPGASLVVKVRYGEHLRAFVGALRGRFDAVAEVKPPASRAESAEAFVVAKGFCGAAAAQPSDAERAMLAHLGVAWGDVAATAS